MCLSNVGMQKTGTVTQQLQLPQPAKVYPLIRLVVWELWIRLSTSPLQCDDVRRHHPRTPIALNTAGRRPPLVVQPSCILSTAGRSLHTWPKSDADSACVPSVAEKGPWAAVLQSGYEAFQGGDYERGAAALPAGRRDGLRAGPVQRRLAAHPRARGLCAH